MYSVALLNMESWRQAKNIYAWICKLKHMYSGE